MTDAGVGAEVERQLHAACVSARTASAGPRLPRHGARRPPSVQLGCQRPDSMRDRSSRSSTSRCIRRALLRIVVEEPPRGLGVGRVAQQRLGVARDRRERRLELVRHVGDEVPADRLEPADLGEVVQHEHGAAGGQRTRVHEEHAAVHVELTILHRPALEHDVHHLARGLDPEELRQVGQRLRRARSPAAGERPGSRSRCGPARPRRSRPRPWIRPAPPTRPARGGARRSGRRAAGASAGAPAPARRCRGCRSGGIGAGRRRRWPARPRRCR